MRDPEKLRSYSWFNGPEYYNLARRAWLRSEGFGPDTLNGKPIVGICNSWSELNNCNVHLRQIAEAVKRGVWAAGGVPLEFPVISLGEMFMKPTSMLFRNLMAMDVEESIRANPIDACVLLCGCDKTTPAQLMGAASADVPALMVTGGPMLAGRWGERTLGSGTDGRKIFDEYRQGRIGDEELAEVEGCIARSHGHCTVMGTASTMASMAEALGMTLPGGAAIPAVDARRYAFAEESGRRAVEIAWDDLRPSQIMTRESVENALRADMAIGGSTNAVPHLLAIARRLGIGLTLDDFDRLSRETPYITNVKPSGEYLMEDFFYAGGLPTVMKSLLPLLNGDALTVNGKTIAENLEAVEPADPSIVRPIDDPIHPEGGTVILKGNLAPDGAVFKQTAASPDLWKHRGPAIVFENRAEMMSRVDDPEWEIDERSVMVLKNCGPHGGPGFPEWGHIPIPKKLLARGVKDMLRISDARMSGTSFGADVLHVSPEAAVGGPLAAVREGDEIEIDVEARTLTLHVPQEEIERRLAERAPLKPHYTRGYGKLFLDHVTQAHEGCDFDFLHADEIDG